MSSKVDQQIFLGEDYVLVWVESFLKERTAQNLAKGTVSFYKEKLLPFVEYLDNQEVKLISQITPNLIREYLQILFERGHNAGGVHGYFRAIKAFLRWYWEELEPNHTNPISKVKAPKVPQEAIEGISMDNFDKLVNTCKGNTFTGERDKAILYTLLDTGVRAKELCSINMDDINFADSSILIRQGKGRKPRYVFFGKKTRKAIRRWILFRGNDNSPLFITREGERITYITLREMIRRMGIKTGVKTSLHDFRRTFCLECLKRGIPEITIARLMGHTTTQLIGRYARQTTIDLMNGYRSVVDE